MEHKIYNPANQPKEWLIQHFVVRTKVFEKIFKDIKTDPMKYPAQHYLIQGQRGMGKTTLLLRLKYEIENSSELNQWLKPVFFNEESYDLTSLSNLWEKLLKYLDELWNTEGTYYKKTDAFIGSNDYEKKCFELLLSILKEKGKKLVIFFDNFGQLFLDNLKEKEQRRFREVLMHCEDIRIIGASAIVLQDLHDYSKPFFEFFKIINLEGLNKDETFQLISKLQENSETKIDLKKNKAKIETLAILTSGVIRTIMLIYEVVLNDQDGSALRDLEIILDRITPLYKHRIEDLPVQQRKIMDVIAKSWDALSTKEIAKNIRENGQPMATKLISAQLQQLEKNNVIDKKQTNTKNHLYQLKERFFNIWYLMRNGDRMDRCRVIWLTKFLETWYSDEKEFDGFIKEHIEHLKSGKYDPEAALTISEALAYSQKLNVLSLDLLLKETAIILTDTQKKSLPDISKQKFSAAYKLLIEQNFEQSLKLLVSIENRNELENALLAANYAFIGNKELATTIQNAINTSNDPAVILLSGITHFLLLNQDKSIELLNNYHGPEQGRKNLLLGENYKLLGDKGKAIEYFIKAIKLNLYEAYYNLISLLIDEKDFVNAEIYSLEAIEHGQTAAPKKLIETYALSLSKQKSFINKIIHLGLKIDKTDPDFLLFKGIMLFAEGKIKAAYISFSQANKLYVSKHLHTNRYHGNLIFLFYIKIFEGYSNKTEALAFAKSITSVSKHPVLVLSHIFILLWNGDFTNGMNLLYECLKENPINDSPTSQEIILNNVFLFLIAKKQYHSLFKIFSGDHYNLVDKFKPTYYALMYFLQDEYPNEYLKMGDELKQPVQDILKEVEEMAIKYA